MIYNEKLHNMSEEQIDEAFLTLIEDRVERETRVNVKFKEMIENMPEWEYEQLLKNILDEIKFQVVVDFDTHFRESLYKGLCQKEE